ncbi:UDP-N-acetylglucosamine-transferase [Granulicella arctica]|uniref:UDP-N-acetylglucosamine-transferase n=1 Tax=Granulicella arctica TaxID=940613 RepID=UPI0021DF78DA|nr:UDP-N-acetylglucosamine-transferase [Granulicella arctica]
MDEQDNLIFVSIASYRDAQLVPTISHCLAKASHPDRLRFGICWQHGEEEVTLPFFDDPRFKILDIDWRDSRGACWARSEIMKLWSGEAWFLQVDSHSRFAPGWDEILIETMRQTGSAKPILSTYPPPFTPSEHETFGGDALQMAFQGFTPEGIPFMKPLAIQNWMHLLQPVRARFLAAGFLFAPGCFVKEVPYDPELYFIGEEATMTVRAFTSGYDLFHPHRLIIWHDYVRAYATRHWDDHTSAKKVDREWSELDKCSKERIKLLLEGELLDSFGLGTDRTLADYEAYAGLSFSQRKGQNYTLRCGEPPNPEAASDWADEIYTWLVRVKVNAVDLPPGSLDDPSFWYVAVNDEGGHEIFRRDFPRAELLTLSGNEPIISLICEFQSGIVPATWSVWPVNRVQGWLQRISGPLAEDDYTVALEEKEELQTP